MESPQIEKRKVNYVCFVPGCKSTSISCTNKHFFFSPKTNPQRQKWITACRRDESKHKLSPSYQFQVCQDHFDIEADLENYMQYKLYKENGIKENAKLKPGVLPHKFDCQPTRLMTQKPPRRSVIEKLERKALIEEAFHKSILGPSSITSILEQPPAEEHISQDVNLESTPTDKAVQTTFYYTGKPTFRSKFIQATPAMCSVGITATKTLVSEATQVTRKKKSKLEISDSGSNSGTISVSSGGSEWIATTTSSGSSVLEDRYCVIEQKNCQKDFLLQCTQSNIQRNPESYLGDSG